MSSYILPRSGDRALKIEGERIAAADSRASQGPADTRWYELALYRMGDGRYAVSIGYRSRWQGELDHDAAYIEATPEAAVAVLRDTVIGAHMIGFPPGERYEEKAAHVQRILQAHYDEAVTEILGSLPPEEAGARQP